MKLGVYIVSVCEKWHFNTIRLIISSAGNYTHYILQSSQLTAGFTALLENLANQRKPEKLRKNSWKIILLRKILKLLFKLLILEHGVVHNLAIMLINHNNNLIFLFIKKIETVKTNVIVSKNCYFWKSWLKKVYEVLFLQK